MSYSIQRAVSDGTLSSLALSIQYYSRNDISVYLGNVLWPVNTVWSWVGATGSTIKFKDPVPAGIEVMVKRITDVSGIRHNFSQGAQFTSATLDDNFKQMLFVAQEAQEGGRTITDVFGDIDMHGFRVRNMGAATELSGAAQLAQAGGGSTGNTPGITYQPFAGDGVTAAFPLTSSSLSMFVFVSGVYQQSTGWGLVGPNLVFSEAPPKGVAIEVLSLGTVGSSAASTSFASSAAIPRTDVQSAIEKVSADSHDSSRMYWTQVGSTLPKSIQDTLRSTHRVSDYPDFQSALAAIAGVEGTGYSASPVELDLLGMEVSFTGVVFIPINVSLVNGKLSSVSGSVVFRNPYMGNTALREYTSYWKYMTSKSRGVTYNCKTIISGYIGGSWADCDFTGPYASLILVNSNSLWTEYNVFCRCSFAANSAVGAGITFDGNTSGSSVYSVGAGAGTPDGSFGYTSFYQCKLDSTAPMVGIKVLDGGVWYNGSCEFRGYARGAGPSGALLYITGGAVSYCNFTLHLESFGTASNIISVEGSGRFWNNTGSIQSASPEMTFAQAPGASIRTNSITVTGAALYNKAGGLVFQGDQAQSKLVNHTLQRLTYVLGDTEFADKLTVNTLYANTSVLSPRIAATEYMESNVPYTGMLTSRPNDQRTTASRNWAWAANYGTYGSYSLLESTTNSNDPITSRLEIKSGGACFNTTGTWGTISDATLKNNVSTARRYLDDLRRIRIVKYSMIADKEPDASMLGVLAQELEVIFPGLVDTSYSPITGVPTKQVKTSVLTYMLVSAVQELADKLDAMSAK